MAETGHPDHVEQLCHLAAATLVPGQAEADVLRHGQVREQAAFLRDVADLALLGRQIALPVVNGTVAEGDRALVGPLEARDHSQQRGLAAAGRTEHRGQRAGRHGEVDSPQYRLAAECLV